MENKIPTQFDTELLVALYMTSAKTNCVSSGELNKFNNFIAKKISERDALLPQKERLNCMFLLSDFHLRQLADSQIFQVSNPNDDAERQISCAQNQPIEKTLKFLRENVLTKGIAQNELFIQVATEFAQMYMKENHPKMAESNKKLLSKEEDEERWWRTFG